MNSNSIASLSNNGEKEKHPNESESWISAILDIGASFREEPCHFRSESSEIRQASPRRLDIRYGPESDEAQDASEVDDPLDHPGAIFFPFPGPNSWDKYQ